MGTTRRSIKSTHIAVRSKLLGNHQLKYHPLANTSHHGINVETTREQIYAIRFAFLSVGNLAHESGRIK